jgi:hypothetical protein
MNTPPPYPLTKLSNESISNEFNSICEKQGQ